MAGGTITRKELITDEGLELGKEYAKNIEVAIEANKELIESAKALTLIASQYQKVANNQQFTTLKQQETLETTKAMNAIKLEAEALKSAEKVKQESIKTRKLELDAINKEESAKSRNTKLTIEERVALEAQNKALKQVARESLGLVNAYEKLNIERANAQRHLANLLAGEKASNSEIRKAQSEFDRLEGKIRKVDTATNNYTKNIGNYKSGLQAVTSTTRDLISALGVVGGITAAVGIAKNIFDTTKELNSLNIALKTVTNGEADFIKQKQFLTQIAEKNGLEIKSLTKTYTQFYIAAKDKLSGTQIQSIFDKVSKSASLMGLSVDQQQGAFLSLQQMMSKGKVQAEELRGQLGERLPGAFGIMARSMNVTTAQLDKMLKDGKVIASEVLPKFAEELEKTYGADKVQRIESIQTAQNRLSNSWVKFIEDNTGNLNQKLAKAISFVADNLETLIKVVGILTGAWLVYKTTIVAIDIAKKAYTATTTALRIAEIALSQGIAAARAEMALFNATASANPIGLIVTLLAVAVASWYAFSDAVDESIRAQKELQAQTKSLKETQDQYNKEGDAYISKRFKEIETEIRLRKAKGEDEKKLAQEEIDRKKEVLEAEISSNNGIIQSSNKRLNEAKKSNNELIALENKIIDVKKQIEGFGFKPSVGKEQLKTELEGLQEIYNSKKNINNLDKNKEKTNVDLLNLRNQELLEKRKELSKEKEIKNAEDIEKAEKKRQAEREKLRADYLAKIKKQEDDAYALQKFRLDRSAELNDEVANDEKQSIQDRVDAFTEAENFKIDSLDLTLKHELVSNALSKIDAKTTSTEKMDLIKREAEKKAENISNGIVLSENASNTEKLIYEKYLKDKEVLSKKEIDDKQKIVDSIVEIENKKTAKILQGLDTELNKKLLAENEFFQEELNSLKGNQKAIEDATKDHEKRVLKIKQDSSKEAIQDQIDKTSQLLQDSKLSADVRAKLENDLSKLQLELNQISVDSTIGSNDEKLEAEKEYNDKIKEISQELASALIDLTNAVFDAKIGNIDYEIQKNDEYYARQIELAGNDQVQKDLLQKEADKKRKKLEDEKRKEQQKQAIFNKAMQAAQITIATIGAVMSALRDVPKFDFGISASTIAAGYAVIGAAQLAAVLATPIPKYEKGTKNHKGGAALVGEKRAEVIMEPGKNPYIIDTPTVLNLAKGTEVIPSVDEYEKMQRASIMASLDIEFNKMNSHQANQTFEAYNMQLLESKIENGIERGFKKANINIQTQQGPDISHELWRIGNVKWGN